MATDGDVTNTDSVGHQRLPVRATHAHHTGGTSRLYLVVLCGRPRLTFASEAMRYIRLPSGPDARGQHGSGEHRLAATGLSA